VSADGNGADVAAKLASHQQAQDDKCGDEVSGFARLPGMIQGLSETTSDRRDAEFNSRKGECPDR